LKEEAMSNDTDTRAALPRGDLAARAARFHEPMPDTEVAVLARRNPDAWSLYAAWHRQQSSAAELTPAQCKTSIRAYLDTTQ
jgi:hypothetical protein